MDLGESSGPVWVFPTRKRPEICDDADFDADATSVREPPPFTSINAHGAVWY